MIACCLVDSGETMGVCHDQGIEPESFYDPANRTIFEVLCSMRDTGKPIDEAVLAEELERKRLLQAVGGIIRLNAITNRVPTTAHRAYYVEQLRNLKGLRDIVAASTAAIEACYSNQGDISGLASSVEQGVLAATRGIESQLPPMVDMADLFKKPPAKPDEVICEMLHRRGLMNIGGMSKARKSWVLGDLALSVATGDPWLGFRTKKGKVLILNFEIDAGFYTERIAAIASARGMMLPRGAITCWNLRGYAADITKLRPAIMARVLGAKYDLVIIDPLYMLIGDRDESNAGDMTDMMNEFSQMAVRGNTAIAFATHFAKGNAANKNSIDRASGSGVLARYPDVIATLTEHEEEDCVSLEVTVRNNKPIPKVGLRWQFPMFQRDESIDPKNLKGLEKPRAKESTETHNSRRPDTPLAEVAQYFPANAEDHVPLAVSQRYAKEGSCIGSVAFSRIRATLRDSGWIEQDKEGRWRRSKLGDEFVFSWKNNNIHQQGATDGSE